MKSFSTFRVFALGALLGLSATVSTSCTPPTKTCNATNCANGCCSNNQCVAGTATNACGARGNMCVSCPNGFSCMTGSCVPTNQGGGTVAGGGSAGGGSTAGGSAGGGSTAGGDAGGSTAGGAAGGDTAGGSTAGGAAGGDTAGGSTAGGAAGGDTAGGAAAGGSVAGGSTAGGSTAGGSTAGGSTAGGATAGGSSGAADILAVRALADSSPDAGPVTGSIPVNGVLVTLIKPQVDAGAGVAVEPEGFFVQAAPGGPGLFVAVSPATDNVQAGDLVSFTVTAAGRNAGIRQATAYTGFTRSSSGNPIGSYAQSINAVDFTQATNLNDWESRLITMNAGVTGTAVVVGTGYRGYNIATTGTPDAGSNFRVRLPGPLADTEDLQPGCNVSLTNGAMWRFNAGAQPSVFTSTQLNGTTCPAPTVVGARADTATAVIVSFDRNIAASTVQAGRFTISALDGGTALNVSAASVTGAREATLTTNAMNGASYQVTCDTAITDSRGTALSSTLNTAQFSGFVAGQCMPGVVISQVYPAGGNSGATYNADFVELRNRTSSPANLSGMSIQYQAATGTSWNVGASFPVGTTIPANGYFLVQVGSASTVPTQLALPSPFFTGATTVSFGATGGKVALVSGSTALPAGACTVAGIVDVVGYGTANCAEGTAIGAPTSTQSAIRQGDGCTDTSNNSTDFALGQVAPRTSASPPAAACTCP